MMNLNDLSFLGLGGGAFSGESGGYGLGSVKEDEVISIISHAIDLGLNHIDTAPIYGFGESERRIGKAVKSLPRENIFIASKCGITWHSTKRVNLSLDPKICQSMLIQSLKDLATEYIDLYYIHYPDPRVDIRFAMEVLAKAKLQQKIRMIGLCNLSLDDYYKAQEVEAVDVVQMEYNYFNQKDVNDFSNILVEKNTKLITWGTFDKGILSATVNEKRSFERCDVRSWAPWWKKSNPKLKIEKASELFKVLQNYEISPAQFCIQLVKKNSKVLSALCGIKSQKQLESAFSYYTDDIDDEIWDGLINEI